MGARGVVDNEGAYAVEVAVEEAYSGEHDDGDHVKAEEDEAAAVFAGAFDVEVLFDGALGIAYVFF